MNSFYVPLALSELKDSSVKVCTVVGFPLGCTAIEVKLSEANWALKQGALEIDMVMNIAAAKSGQWEIVENDIRQLALAVHQHGAILKVILETCLLSDPEKIEACQRAWAAGADFVKTSTGFSSGGATVADVALMRKTVGQNLGVKASGGVRDRETAMAMIEAGATRLGTSAGVFLVTSGQSSSGY